MAYQLKTTGIAANCTMCIAVDPDTGTIKDFASSAVTTDLVIGANVTIGSQAWDGNTRSYWRSGSGTTDADFVKFGTNKPVFQINGTVTNTTVVYIGEAASAYVRVFGSDSTNYIAGQSGAVGGNTFPYSILASNSYTGNQTALTAGQKAIFGFVFRSGGTSDWFAALHNDASMATGNISSIGSPTLSWTLNYVGRRNDATGHNQDKTHAILVFNTALSTADWDSLRDDWFGTLLEAAGGSGASASGATLTATASLIAGSASGSGNTTASGVTLTATSSLITGSASGVINGVLTFQAAGLEFGGRTGLGIDTFALDNGVSYRYSVHADGLTLGAAILTSSAIALDSAGKLPNLVSNLLTPGSTYRIFAIRQTDGEAATFRLTAS